MHQGFAQQTLGVLVAEWCGPHVLIRHRDEAYGEHAVLNRSPSAAGQLFVLASPRAQRESSIGDAIPALLRPLLNAADIKSIWLGVARLAANPQLTRRLSRELRVDVLAPDGAFVLKAGAAMYAGHGMGGTGWKLFRPEGPVRPIGTRYPLPAWESAMPAAPLVSGGVVAQPVPAGLLIRAAPARPAGIGDVAFGIAIDYRHPKIIVGGAGPAPTPAAVAAVLKRLRPGSYTVVPEAPGVASYAWQAELALRLPGAVVFGTGAQFRSADGRLSTFVLDSQGNNLFRPFPTILRQSAGGGDQQVLDIAPAPPGWMRSGPRAYRLADGSDDVLAEVVPSGLVLRSPTAKPADEAASFDPSGWTLNLGTPGEQVSVGLLAVTERLLASLDPEQRAFVRIRVVGTLDERAKAAVGHGAPQGDSRRDVPSPRPVAEPPSAGARAAPAAAPVAAPVRPMPLVTPPLPRPSLSMSGPPVMTTSAAPVSTVSGPPRRPSERSEPDAFDSGAIGSPRLAQIDTQSEISKPGAASPAPSSKAPGEQSTVPPRLDDREPVAEVQPPADVFPPSAAEPVPAGKPLVIPDRASTAAEQTRFTAAAGEAFGEALATVNAALATWPSMRHSGESDVKADYVAVCLYLGRGEMGAAGVNGAVRTGQSGTVDGQLSCLVSGIRRLPTHRRAVLRQGKLGKSLEQHAEPGAVFVEPGFLSASMDLDVTVPGADLDVLIWPCSARRTSELMMSRPMNEAVFVAGARFKALAVRTSEHEDPPEDEGPAAPRVAVLFRELAPGETPETAELDARDLAVLAKLDRVLVHRQKGALRLVEDPDTAARLTFSMLEWHESMAVNPVLDPRTAAAS